MAFNVDLTLPPDFSNRVKLFPLPNVVLFPGVMQGLHIFEPRYRQMMQDALADDQLITMASLQPPRGGEDEQSYFLRPDIFQTVCIGKIVTHSRTDDGKYNLLLVGAKRARIVEEIVSDKAYRVAEVEILEDVRDVTDLELADLRNQLIGEFKTFASQRQGLSEQTLKNMLVDTMPFSVLIDLICYASGLDTLDQVKVLETTETGRRCELVLGFLREKMNKPPMDEMPRPDDLGDFPPNFSLN